MDEQNKVFLLEHLKKAKEDMISAIERRRKIIDDDRANYRRALTIHDRVEIGHEISVMTAESKLFQKCVDEIKEL